MADEKLPILQGDPQAQPATPAPAPAAPPAAAPALPLAPQAPQMVPFQLGDKVFHVPQDFADAVRQAAQPAVPSASAVQPAPAPATAAPDPLAQIESVWYTNPREAVKMLRDEFKREVVTEMTEAYRQAENTKELWSKFDMVNPQLRGVNRDYVMSIVNANRNELNSLPVDAGLKRIGELVANSLLAFQQQLAQNAPPVLPVLAEGGGRPAPAVPAQEASGSETITLSDAIRQMQAKRRAPRSQG